VIRGEIQQGSWTSDQRTRSASAAVSLVPTEARPSRSRQGDPSRGRASVGSHRDADVLVPGGPEAG